MSNSLIEAKTTGVLTSQDRSNINKTITLTNTNQTGIATNVSAIALNTAAREAQAARESVLVEEITALITLTNAEIVGTTAGIIGHVDGAVLVAAPTSDYILEFVSAVLIYDFLTAAYGGGGDDVVIQGGDAGTQVVLSSAITGANLLEAAGDKIVRLGPIDTEVVPLVGGALSIAGTALTDPGTADGSLRVHLTYRKHTTGL